MLFGKRFLALLALLGFFRLSYGLSQEKEASNGRVLSRSRRYLIFPEGSSLQLVYDQIVPIVDYTNLYIFGLTVALAWQLPDRPDYPEHHRVDEKVALRRTGNVTASKPFDVFNRENYHNWDTSNKHGAAYERIRSKLKAAGYKMDGKYGGSLGKFEKKYQTMKKGDGGFKPHYIYPALRMRRRIEDARRGNEMDGEEQQHWIRHQSTRHSLYASIEKYLNAKNENGTECIRRAICESSVQAGKSSNDENVPTSFVQEILRVIFSLPGGQMAIDSTLNSKFRIDRGDNQRIEDYDCSLKFPKCRSIWSDEFVF